MTREVSRENSQDALDKDPKAIRPDIVGKPMITGFEDHTDAQLADAIEAQSWQSLCNREAAWRLRARG